MLPMQGAWVPSLVELRSHMPRGVDRKYIKQNPTHTLEGKGRDAKLLTVNVLILALCPRPAHSFHP